MATDPQPAADVTDPSRPETDPAASPSGGTAPIVTHNRAQSRFEIAVADARAGAAEYTDEAGRRIFFHTEVADAHAGQGLAGVLVRQALDMTRAEGLRVVPVCPYVARYVQRHHDWDDIVDPVDDRALDAVRQATR